MTPHLLILWVLGLKLLLLEKVDIIKLQDARFGNTLVPSAAHIRPVRQNITQDTLVLETLISRPSPFPPSLSAQGEGIVYLGHP